MIPQLFSDAEMRAAFAWWLSSNQDDPRAMLHRLHLPGTRRRILISLRDRQLVAAAEAIAPGAPTYRKTVLMLEAIRQFAGHQWPVWQRMQAPPTRAEDAAHLLWHAFKSAANIDALGTHSPERLGKTALFKLLKE